MNPPHPSPTPTTTHMPDGTVKVVLDHTKLEGYVEFNHVSTIDDREAAEDFLDSLGLEMMDEDECPAELVDRGYRVHVAIAWTCDDVYDGVEAEYGHYWVDHDNGPDLAAGF